MHPRPEMQREMLRQMQTIRRFEERATQDYLAGDIYGSSIPISARRRWLSAFVPRLRTETRLSARTGVTVTASPKVLTSTA